MSPRLAKKNDFFAPRKSDLKILVVTGQSGGHIFPALAFLETLKDKNKGIETLLVLPSKSIKKLIIPDGYKLRHLSISKVGLRFDIRNFIAIFAVLKGTLESLFLLLEFRPDIVVGFGSLYCVPLLLFAWIFRIKILIHEQNVIPGRANRLLAKFADRIAISFAETRTYLKMRQDRIAFTGNPVRQELKMIERSRAFNFFGFDNDKFTILVMGGSRGSHRINTSFQEAVSTLPDKSKFQVIHIAGAEDFYLLDNSYRQTNLKIKLFAFLKDMQYAYSICDLAVCRAGATTIAELIFFGLPAILVPYPFAYRHQLSNARVLERMGSAVVIKNQDLDAGILRRLLDEFINNPNKIQLMRSYYDGTIKTNANDLLVAEVLSLA